MSSLLISACAVSCTFTKGIYSRRLKLIKKWAYLSFLASGPVYILSKKIMFSLKVIDYLCVVGKLTDKGHNSLLVEETLVLFKNNSEKVCCLIHLRTFLIYQFNKIQLNSTRWVCWFELLFSRLTLYREFSQQIFVCRWILVHCSPFH